MIGLITQNNMIKKVLTEILKEFPVEIYTKGHQYDFVIVTEKEQLDQLKENESVIGIGVSGPNEITHIDIPVSPKDLVRFIKKAYIKKQGKTTFENNVFVFQKNERLLILKGTNTVFPLTEKENDIVTVLAEAFPKAFSKEELLKTVWNYRPDIETHTVESHIYALRQKIGDRADDLIQSTSEGYVLIKG